MCEIPPRKHVAIHPSDGWMLVVLEVVPSSPLAFPSHVDLSDPPPTLSFEFTNPVDVSDGLSQPKTFGGAMVAKRTCDGEAKVQEASCLHVEGASELRKQFENATPFPHGVLHPLCRDQGQVLRRVRRELLENVSYREKETDLFQVHQTGDLANLDGFREELPALWELREALYSRWFRQAVEEATGCGKLSDQIDLSSNIYDHGGHLLCHDDVIGNRRVSFIIYLTDPDTEWKEEDGGTLELFGIDEKGECENIPCKTILPLWNSMAMFVVQPGRSYHEVREVFAKDKPRLSVSGWYHSDEPLPDGNGVASLAQLQTKDAGGLKSNVYHSLSYEKDLNMEDLLVLKKYLNRPYLSPATWHAVAKQFQEQGSIQLQSFLSDERVAEIMSACLKADQADGLAIKQRPEWDAGTGDGWQTRGPPVKQRYQEFVGGDNIDSARAAAGKALKHVVSELLQTPSFAKLLSIATGKQLKGQVDRVRRFRPGLDYTVAHFNAITADPVLDLTLCFVNNSDEERSTNWESGVVGGYHCYIPADPENNAATAEVYRPDDDDDELLSISAVPNSMNLVLRQEGLMDFVKYISTRAGGSRWDISMEYQLED